MEIKRDIKLSEWFVCFEPNRNFPGKKNLPADDYGPLRIYSKDKNCNIHLFGHENKNIIIFEGFIYDDENLIPGHEPLSTSCSKLASIYYEKYGDKVFDRLKGRYLLAIWDNDNQKLLVGRDGLGKHPVYYSDSGGKFWFSSNLLALSSSGFIDNTPDRLSLSLLILGSWPENESTSFKDIKKPRPGYYLKIDRSKNLKKVFYFTPMPDDEEPYIDEKESMERFEQYIINSANKCMKLKPQGLMLSGGIDSVIVAALSNIYVKNYNLDPLIACSGRKLPGATLNYEESMQDKVTSHFNMPHIKSNIKDWIGNKNLTEASLEEISDFPYPTHHFWAGGFMNFWRGLSKKGIYSFLTGSGGDELFGLHGAYTADLIKSMNLIGLANFLQSEKRGGKSWKKIINLFLLTHGFKLIAGSYWKKYLPESKSKYNKLRISKTIPPWLITDNNLRNEIVEIIYNRRTPETLCKNKIPKDYYRHSLRASFKNGYLDYEAECNYHNTHSAGVSFTSPYHDLDAIKFFLRVKPELFMYGKNYKGLLRSLAAKYLPGFELENQKKLYEPFESNFSVRSLCENTIKILNSSKLSNIDNFGIIDKNCLKKEYNSHNNLNFTQNYRLFSIISVDRWLSKNT